MCHLMKFFFSLDNETGVCDNWLISVGDHRVESKIKPVNSLWVPDCTFSWKKN